MGPFCVGDSRLSGGKCTIWHHPAEAQADSPAHTVVATELCPQAQHGAGLPGACVHPGTGSK